MNRTANPFPKEPRTGGGHRSPTRRQLRHERSWPRGHRYPTNDSISYDFPLYAISQPHERALGFSVGVRKDDPTLSPPTKPRNVHKLAEILAMTEYRITKHFTIPVEINGVINVKAMLDTGATANFIHQELVDRHGIQTVPRKEPLTTKDIHGRVLAVVKDQAIFRMRTRSHIETITMDVMPTGRHSLVLGLPWMEIHDPWVKMAERELIFTSQYCRTNCLNIDDHVDIHTPQDNEGEIYGVDGTTFADPRKYVPEELHDYLDVFNDRTAKKMPRSRGEWDFQINFIEGWETRLPRPAKRY
jgi:hypothetical protein